MPMPAIVYLTAAFDGSSPVTVVNPGAPEGKVFFLQSVQSGDPLLMVRIMPSANFPDGVFLDGFPTAEGVLRFDPPLPIEAGVEVFGSAAALDDVAFLSGFYGDPTNVIVNGAPMIVIPGDFNLDGRVDLNDFNTFANNFTG